MRHSGERTREQELKHEVKSLKEELSKIHRESEKELREKEKEIKLLRRQLSRSEKDYARVDLDRYGMVREMVEEHLAGEDSRDEKSFIEKVKKEWTCHKCVKGHLEYITYPRAGEIWYRRECTLCDHGTKGQPYHPEVRGLQKTSVVTATKFGAKR